MVNPTIFNFYDYLKNPMADYCVSKYQSKTIYTLEDFEGLTRTLRYTRFAIENNKKQSIGDQIRLLLATKTNDFLYLDADCYIPDFTEIISNKNCTAYIPYVKKINNGSFFYTDKSCEFNKYYFDLYETVDEEDLWLSNLDFFNKHPFKQDFEHHKSGDMNLLDSVKLRHFYISHFYRFKKLFPDIDKVYYSFDNFNSAVPVLWMFDHCPPHNQIIKIFGKEIWFYETVCDFIPQDDLVRLFKEQMNYTYQKNLKFIEV